VRSSRSRRAGYGSDPVARPVTRYDSLVEGLREASRPEREAPPDFAPYLDKVRRKAYTVTDEDVQALKDAGYSEDAIFEETVSVAAAAGLERLEAALEVLP
jgi:alkylhydroperoxidase family enzyme